MAKWNEGSKSLLGKLKSIQSELNYLYENTEYQFTSWAPEGSKLDIVSDNIYNAVGEIADTLAEAIQTFKDEYKDAPDPA